MGIPKPCPLFASSVRGTDSWFHIPTFQLLPWGSGHPRRPVPTWAKSQDDLQMGPGSPRSPGSP